ncbi:MAG: cache domain-containing protein [Sedimentisphaerales bacterium]|nr:cache domain-containing protein [Sedimentisphaerales bacterium]
MQTSLRVKLVISFLAVIIIYGLVTTLVGMQLISRGIINQVQIKIKHDLDSAWEVYRNETENLKDIVRFTALRFFIKDAVLTGNIEELEKELNRIRKTESLDILTITDSNGKVIIRSRNPSVRGDNQARDEIISRVLSNNEVTVATQIVPREELLKEGMDLAEQARIKCINTPKAKPCPKTEQTSGMMIKAAAPVIGYNNSPICILYGGRLLNRNYDIVDRVKKIVYREAKYKGRDTGTATIFQGDLRISTNVCKEDGTRAIGTRVSEEVHEQVVVKGLPWIDRAFVVTDWFKTAYEPIRNINGDIIGMLYVGTLEKPFTEMTRNIVLVFLLIVFVATLLAFALALTLSSTISKPLTNVLKAIGILSEGKLGYKVDAKIGTKELNTLVASFNNMSEKLDQREQYLKISNDKLTALNQTYLDLVSFVSHELKSVLGSTILYTDSLRNGFLGTTTSEQKKALDAVTLNLDYLTETVRKFFNLSRIEKGELELNRTELCLKENIFNVSMQTFARHISEKEMEIINNLQPEMKINGDIDLLVIAANNLLSNAIKFGFNKGKIELSSKDIGNMLQVEIYNDSRPVREEEKIKLFKKFSRLNVHREQNTRGTGLGLFITKEIIIRHGGKIWVEPKENGNTFIFQIEKGLRESG